MSYKWRPSVAQRRAFAEKMQDPEERTDYEARKRARAEKRRASSRYDYYTAGGSYIPTTAQFKVAGEMLELGVNVNEANMVIYGYTCGERVAHDNIHMVNEFDRKKTLL